MKSSLKTLLAVGALALAAGQASASTINLTTGFSGSTGQVTFPGDVAITVAGGVTGAKFQLRDALEDGITVNYQLYQDNDSSGTLSLGDTAWGAGWSFLDIGTTAQNLASTSVYRALNSGVHYVLRVTGISLNPNVDAISASTQVSAVPLPAAAWLFGSALLGMGALRRKQAAAKDMAAV